MSHQNITATNGGKDKNKNGVGKTWSQVASTPHNNVSSLDLLHFCQIHIIIRVSY